MTIREMLRAEKAKRRLSEARMGEQIRSDEDGSTVSQTTINRWLNDKDVPSPPYYDSIATFLGISPRRVEALAEEARQQRNKRAIGERLDALERKVDQVTLLIEALEERRARR